MGRAGPSETRPCAPLVNVFDGDTSGVARHAVPYSCSKRQPCFTDDIFWSHDGGPAQGELARVLCWFNHLHEVVAFCEQSNTFIADADQQVAFACSNESDSCVLRELASIEDGDRVACLAFRVAGHHCTELSVAGPQEEPEQKANDGERCEDSKKCQHLSVRRALEDLDEANGVFVVDNDDLAAAEQDAVDADVHRRPGGSVELDHGSDG